MDPHMTDQLNSPGIEGGFLPDETMAAGSVTIPQQTHTCNVGVIGTDGPSGTFADTDALICFRPGTAIGVRTADCVPVLLHAPDAGAVAAIHAGWKGSLGGIVTRAVRMLTEAGADPQLMRAFMGPCISGKNYEVSAELAERFRAAGFADCVTGERHLDLPAVNRKRLMDEGIPAENIRMPEVCTMESTVFPSWRREPGTTARLLSWIRLR